MIKNEKRQLKFWSSKFLRALSLDLLQQLQDDILKLTVLLGEVTERGEYLRKYENGEIEKTSDNYSVYQVLLHEYDEFFAYCDSAFRLRLSRENERKLATTSPEAFNAEIARLMKPVKATSRLWEGYMRVNVGRNPATNCYEHWHTTSYMLADFFEIQRLTEQHLIDPFVIDSMRAIINKSAWMREDFEHTVALTLDGQAQ